MRNLEDQINFDIQQSIEAHKLEYELQDIKQVLANKEQVISDLKQEIETLKNDHKKEIEELNGKQ